MISGLNLSLVEEKRGNHESGGCGIAGSVPRALDTVWDQDQPERSPEHIDFLMDDRRAVFTRHGATKLPTELGEGYAAYIPVVQVDAQNYQVTSRFACSGKDRILDLNIARFAKGRDAVRDMIDLMRIAQKRYGEIHKCTVGK
ncbi:hypothetical protein [Sinosporangium siamense]|uniref:Uncharacterized protein n=2 Tax=Sinosporangium siamense TaxID=1367973 RepID=A0A919RLV9_9ACTN|nr:hypothetical protein [Sinosporangium siamense]GII95592.1 hypothetical protein Ssi02_58230 [Sinosporangium siamense]